MRILFAAASYLLGSIPTGYLVVRLSGRKDVRDLGSGSTGATNVLRVQGLKAAVPVAFFDVLKGFLPAFLALSAIADPAFAAVCGLLAVVGHCFPFAIGFRGGKGVATALGAYAAIAIGPCLGSVGVFLVAVAATRYVSLGSILASLAFPVLVLATGGPAGVVAVSLALAALIVFQHRGNIARLAAGSERRLGGRAP